MVNELPMAFFYILVHSNFVCFVPYSSTAGSNFVVSAVAVAAIFNEQIMWRFVRDSFQHMLNTCSATVWF